MGEIRREHTLMPGQLVSLHRLQPDWRLLHGINFSKVGASVREGWQGGAPRGSGHRALEEEAEGSQAISCMEAIFRCGGASLRHSWPLGPLVALLGPEVPFPFLLL